MDKAAQRTLEELRNYARPAAIAEIGGFRPPDSYLTSWFGGRGVGLPDEALPSWRERDMFCLLQINIAELPVVPPALEGIAFLTVFLDRYNIPFDQRRVAHPYLRES